MRRNFAQILKEAKIDIKSETQFREMLMKANEESEETTEKVEESQEEIEE